MDHLLTLRGRSDPTGSCAAVETWTFHLKNIFVKSFRCMFLSGADIVPWHRCGCDAMF